MSKKVSAYYAVGVGRQRGVYKTWPECQKNVLGLQNARYKKFSTYEAAVQFVDQFSSPCSSVSSPGSPKISPFSAQTPIQAKKKLLISNGIPPKPSSSRLQDMGMTKANHVNEMVQPSVSAVTNQHLPCSSKHSSTWSSSQKICLQATASRSSFYSALSTTSQNPVKISNGVYKDVPKPPISSDNDLTSIDINELNVKVKNLERKLGELEENLRQVMEFKSREIEELRTEILDIKKIISTFNGETPSLDSTVEKLQKQKAQNEARNPVKKTKFIEQIAEECSHESAKKLKTMIGDSASQSRELVTLDSEASQSGDLVTLSIDSEGYCIVYTDGACTNNGREGAKAGIGVWFGDNHPLNVSEPARVSPATNNNAEIQAACYAINVANISGIKKLCIHTDSQFLINCVTLWMPGWKKKGWKTSSGAPVKNKMELERLEEAQKGIEIKWVHVRGHASIHGNEEADRLASLGAMRYES